MFTAVVENIGRVGDDTVDLGKTHWSRVPCLQVLEQQP